MIKSFQIVSVIPESTLYASAVAPLVVCVHSTPLRFTILTVQAVISLVAE